MIAKNTGGCSEKEEVSSVDMKTNAAAKEEQQILTPERTKLSKLSIDYSWLWKVRR